MFTLDPASKLGLLSTGLLLTLLSTKGFFCFLPTYGQSSMIVDIKLYHKTLYYYTHKIVLPEIK